MSTYHTGKWTLEEHNLYIIGLELFDRDYAKLHNFIKTRSRVQIRTHDQKMKQKKKKMKYSTSTSFTKTALDILTEVALNRAN